MSAHRESSGKGYMRKLLFALLAAVALFAGGSVISPVAAQASTTTLTNTCKSQSDLWIEFTNGVQDSVLRCGTGYTVNRMWVGANWCTGVTWNGGATWVYYQGGTSGRWFTLTGGRESAQTWYGCWG